MKDEVEETPTRDELRRACGRAVRRLRERAELAQYRLALEAGVDRTYISGIEHGRHNLSLAMIYRLLPILGVTFREFAEQVERERKRGTMTIHHEENF